MTIKYYENTEVYTPSDPRLKCFCCNKEHAKIFKLFDNNNYYVDEHMNLECFIGYECKCMRCKISSVRKKTVPLAIEAWEKTNMMWKDNRGVDSETHTNS